MSKAYELFEGIVTNYGISRDDEMVKSLFDLLEAQGKSGKPEITEAGLAILEYLQNCETENLKSKDIAEGMGISSRKVSGSIRKLVTDGYVEKVGQDPVIYSITAKGKEFNIETYKNQQQENKN